MTVEPEMNVRVPFAPFERYVARCHPDPDAGRQQQASIHDCVVAAPWIETLTGVHRRKVAEWRANGIGYFDADACATRLGVHPERIWTDWWLLEEPEPVWRQLRREAHCESVRLRQVTAA